MTGPSDLPQSIDTPLGALLKSNYGPRGNQQPIQPTASNRFVFMTCGGDGVDSQPTQVHLRDGTVLYPIGGGGTANAFAVPVQFTSDLRAAGFEAQSDLTNRMPQGPTRPTSPAVNSSFFDTTIRRLVTFDGSTWRDAATNRPA